MTLPGVISANVNLATEQLKLSQTLSLSQLQQALAGSRYQLSESSANKAAEHSPSQAATRFYQAESWPVLGAALLTLPLVLPMVGLLFGVDWMLPALWQWLLATPVQFYFGVRFYKAACQRK